MDINITLNMEPTIAIVVVGFICLTMVLITIRKYR